MYFGICKLCKHYKKLVKSHVIPEWAYKSMYDDSHKLVRINTNHKSPIGFAHSGEWDRFLCHKCEDSFKELDEYGRAIIYSKELENTFGIETQPAEYGVNIVGVDYKRMKLFQISVLWRAGVSDRDFFSSVQLGEHEKKLREILISEIPGDGIEYGCIMSGIIYEPRKMLDEVIDKPAMYSDNSWNMVRFLFAGCAWIYVLHDDAHNYPYRKYFLTPGAPLPMQIFNVRDLPGLVNHLSDFGDLK